MSIKCTLGFHTWDGCKCTVCGKVREEQHDWSKDCDKCSKCGKARENQHNWSKDCEKCSICGKTRQNQHDWLKDCEMCSKCGKTSQNTHVWTNCKCDKCGARASIVIASNFLHNAAKVKDLNQINALLKNDVDINSKDNEGFTILIFAVMEGDAGTVKWLLDHGADPSGGITDITALHMAAQMGHNDIVTLLLAKGADKDALESSMQATPMILAAAAGQTIAVKHLIFSGADKTKRDSSGMAAIHYAASNGHVDVVKTLIEAGVDPNTIGEENYLASPLHYATLKGHSSVVQCLVQSGANIDVKDIGGNSPLMIAQEEKNNDIISALSGKFKESKISESLQHYKPNHISTELTREAVKELHSGNFDVAISILNKAVLCDKNNADAWSILASLLERKHDKRSSECAMEYIRIRPESLDGYEQLIFSYRQTERMELALEAAQNYAKLFPNHANAWSLLAAFYVATVDDKEGIDKGIEYYEKALKLDPNNELANESLPSLYSTKNLILSTNKDTQNKNDDEQKRLAEIRKNNSDIDWIDEKTGCIIDPRDNNNYKVVIIGEQIIMAENLRYKVDKGCWKLDENDENFKWLLNNGDTLSDSYGCLYDWQTAKNISNGIKGWHLPTDEDWDILYYNISEDKHEVFAALEEGSTSGFNALLGGYRDSKGFYKEVGATDLFWSSSSIDLSQESSEFNDMIASLAMMAEEAGEEERADSITSANVFTFCCYAGNKKAYLRLDNPNWGISIRLFKDID